MKGPSEGFYTPINWTYSFLVSTYIKSASDWFWKLHLHYMYILMAFFVEIGAPVTTELREEKIFCV